MLLLATALAAAAQSPAPAPSAAAPPQQARATVRILRPASLRVGAAETLEGQPLRKTSLRDRDGRLIPAFLAEFQ